MIVRSSRRDSSCNRWRRLSSGARIRSPPKARARDILFRTDKRLPVVEVWVDLEQEQITDILSPPEKSDMRMFLGRSTEGFIMPIPGCRFLCCLRGDEVRQSPQSFAESSASSSASSQI